GAGGRAASDIQGCASENMVAFADPDAASAANTFNHYEKAVKYADFRKMLDKEGKNIDAVIVATPDHMHATAALAAMERGKHVCVEKPLTRTVWEARLLAEAAAKHKVATQMGNQGYSNEGTRIAAEIIWSGEIGNVTEVHAWTNRPIWPQGVTEIPPESPAPSTLDWDLWLGIAKARPYAAAPAGSGGGANRPGFYNPFNWRGFFEFGCGALGDMACHILGSVNMALLLGAPSSVEVISQEGKSPFQFPKKSVTRFEFPARGNMPPVKVFWYDARSDAAFRPPNLPEGEPLIGGQGSFGSAGQLFSGTGAVPPAGRGRGGNAPAGAPPAGAPGGAVTAAAPGRGGRGGGGGGGGSQSNGAVFVGEKGVVTTDTYANNCRLLPLERHNAYRPPPPMLTRSPGHHRDWLRACRGGDPACSNFSVAGPFTEWIVLGALALHFEGKLEWDAARMKITNNPEANGYLTPEVR